MPEKLTFLVQDIVASLVLCHQALKDHVQYEQPGEITLEGEAFRIADEVLKRIGEIPCSNKLKVRGL